MSCCFLEVQGQVKVRCGERKGVSTGITSELGRRHPLLAHSFSNLLSLSFPSTRHLLKKTSTVNKAKEPTMPLFAPRRSPRNHQTLGDKIATAFRSNGRSHRQNRVAGLKVRDVSARGTFLLTDSLLISRLLARTPELAPLVVNGQSWN